MLVAVAAWYAIWRACQMLQCGSACSSTTALVPWPQSMFVRGSTVLHVLMFPGYLATGPADLSPD